MSFFDRFRTLTKKEETRPDSALATPLQAAIERRMRKRKNARQGATALIIDDSPTVVAALRKILRSAGYITHDAGDAEQGLALLTDVKADIIFLDIVLHFRSGCRRQSNQRTLADFIYDRTDTTIFRTEIMPPFRNTMCFVHCIKRNIDLAQKLHIFIFGQ